LVCKPFEHYPESKIYQNCRNFQTFANNVTNNSVNFIQEQTYKRGIRNVKGLYHWTIDLKNSLLNSLDDIYFNIKKSLRRKVVDVKERVTDTYEATKENAKEYCDAGLQKVNGLVEELKREKAKYLGTGNALKPYQEQELEAVGYEINKFKKKPFLLLVNSRST
jgi:hypothetical protein